MLGVERCDAATRLAHVTDAPLSLFASAANQWRRRRIEPSELERGPRLAATRAAAGHRGGAFASLPPRGARALNTPRPRRVHVWTPHVHSPTI